MRHLIDQWFKPYPYLGFHLTCIGIVLLMVSLVLNRLFPDLSFDPDDWRAASLVIGYAVAHWAMWLVGGILVMLGSARIFSMIDD